MAEDLKVIYDFSSDSALVKVDQKIFKEFVGEPGEYPYTRGIYPNMYTDGKLPTVRKYGGFGSGVDLNKHLKTQLKQGVTGLSIAYDLPTQMGYDPDHPMSNGEVGVNGASIACLRDYEEAFKGLMPQLVKKGIGVSKTINATAPILLAFYIAQAKKQGISPKNLRGTIQNDVLKEYLSRNTYIYPLDGTLRLARDTFLYCKERLPKFNTISICGYHMREKGSSAPQELAFMFANAMVYIHTALKAGLTIDEFASQISFFLNVKKDFFEEIAKLRAARRIWALLLREGFGAKDPRSLRFRVQAYTGGSDLRREKPHLNIARDAVRALACVLGSPQGINVTSFDEAITIPTALSQTIAIDTSYIALLEKGATRVADPLGGSYYLEAKTIDLQVKVWKELETLAGFPTYQKALSYMRSVLEEEAYQENLDEDLGIKKIAGKNIALEGARYYPKVEIFKLGEAMASQRKRLNQWKRFKDNRDESQAQSALKVLSRAAFHESSNIFPFILDAVEANATLGEITSALKKVFSTSDSYEPWLPCQGIQIFSGRLKSLFKAKSSETSRAVNMEKIDERGYAMAQDLPYSIQSESEVPGLPPYTRGASVSHEVLSELPKGCHRIEAWKARETKASASQEVAFALNEALKRKADKPLCVCLSSHNDFFEEIAKFRAARRVWARIAPSRRRLIFAARTSFSTLSKDKPFSNIARIALQGFQGILAGVEYLELLPFDMPLRKRFKTRNSRLATRDSLWADQLTKDMRLLLVHEFGALGIQDPLGGSFYLEALTDRLEAEISKLIHSKAGGSRESR